MFLILKYSSIFTLVLRIFWAISAGNGTGLLFQSFAGIERISTTIPIAPDSYRDSHLSFSPAGLVLNEQLYGIRSKT
jgi:hypothetical protein